MSRKVMLETAMSSLRDELRGGLPFMAGRVEAWMAHIAPTGRAEDRFTPELMFPIFDLPQWAQRSLGEPAEPFLAEVTYSTLNGYYFIRLIDDLIDKRHSAAESGARVDAIELLPAMSFFHTEFQRVYQAHFAAEHPFWNVFRSIWYCSCESMWRDATLDEVDPRTFAAIGAKKLCAAQIPVAAVFHHAGRPERLAPWLRFCEALADFHQRLDDLVDWFEDLSHGTRTLFLSEAQRRKRESESTSMWIAREGFDWAKEALEERHVELAKAGEALDSADVHNYLQRTTTARRKLLDDCSSGLRALSAVAAHLR